MIAINSKQTKRYFSNNRTSRATNSAHLKNDVRGEEKYQIHHCNICRQPFVPEFKYQLFCGKCRNQDESFMFNEWLPHLPESVSMTLGY